MWQVEGGRWQVGLRGGSGNRIHSMSGHLEEASGMANGCPSIPMTRKVVRVGLFPANRLFTRHVAATAEAGKSVSEVL